MKTIKSTMNKAWVGCFLLMLIGCSAAPPNAEVNQYYLLTHTTLPSSIDRNVQTTEVALKPLNVPAYLTQKRLVMKGQSADISYANYHHWAETPQKAMHAALLDKLNANQSSLLYSSHCRSCRSVHVTIRSFYPTVAGEVELSGFYEIKNADKRTIKQRPFRMREHLNTGGYDEAVQRMSGLLDKLANRIAHEQ